MTVSSSEPETLSSDFKETVQLQLDWFKENTEDEVLRFPSCFESHEQDYIIEEAKKMGLNGKSVGKNCNKHVSVTRPVQYTECDSHNMKLRDSSVSQIHMLLRDLPVKPTELTDLQAQVEYPAGTQQLTNASNEQKFKDMNRRQMGKLFNANTMTIPSRPQTTDVNYLEARQRLMICQKRDVILQTVMENQVVIISGDTGCGKTTQVPQYILEEATANQSHCFMYVTQPRRIAAIAAAERVSQERGERVGTSVGYQIRLEYRSTQKTVLTYCTNSVLLRALMLAGPHDCLEQVTHIIVDEVHEREMYSDFLLNIMRDILPVRPYLRLVLMTADPDPKELQNYFNNAPIVSVNSSTVEVHAMFLESVLSSTRYHEKFKYQENLKSLPMSTEECAYRTSLDAVTSIITCRMKQRGPTVEQGLTARMSQLGMNEGYQGHSNYQQKLPMYQGNYDGNYEVTQHNNVYGVELGEILGIGEQTDVQDSCSEVWLHENMDVAMETCLEQFNETTYNQMQGYILSESVGVDYQHTASFMTALMISASKGSVEMVEKLLNLGADPNVSDLRGNDTYKHAESHPAVLKLLKDFNSEFVTKKFDNSEETKIIASKEEKGILETYYKVVDSSKADLDIIFYLISLILDCQQPDGSVLVFLPSYDDITRLRSMLMQDQNMLHKIHIFMLHSSMQPFEQRKVFRKSPYGIRKVILSTGIAETALTIDDVMFVIDSGRIEERVYDAKAGLNKYTTRWISKKSANYRRSRAGRTNPGVCYHLFSKDRYKTLQEVSLPELFRVSLSEIALNTKVLAPHNMPIAEFLSKSIEPPDMPALKKAIGELTKQEALTPWEELTTVGKHLAELPIDPHLGKVVLYSVILKCLDPVLTIVCSLAYTDPFTHPSEQHVKVAALQSRRRFSINSQSDHLSSLKAFLGWQKARANGWEHQFCEKNFLSLAKLEMIEGLRAQIIAQLRSMGFIRQKGGVDIRNLNDNSDKWYIVKACLVGGLYPRLARVNREDKTLYTCDTEKLELHNDSVLNLITTKNLPKTESQNESVEKLASDWLVYDEIIADSNNKMSLRCCTVVSALTVALFAGSSGSLEESEETYQEDETVSKTLQLDDWIAIDTPDIDGALSIKQLRLKFHALFQRRLKTPFSQLTQVDTSILRCIVSILKQEEEPMNLTQPAGIAQRPFRPYDHAYHTRYHMPHVISPSLPFDDIIDAHQQQWHLKNRGYDNNNNNNNNNYNYSHNRDGGHGQRPVFSGGVGSAGGVYPGGLETLPNAAYNAGYPPAVEEQYYTQQQSVRGNAEQYGGQLQYSSKMQSGPVNAKYFIMKCGNQQNIEGSVQSGYWQTSVNTEKKLSQAYAICKNVFLIFSVQTSGHFQGYARMIAPFTTGSNGGMVRIEWLKRANLPFQRCHHLYNPWNENRKVQVARDGQELEPTVGEGLLRLWDDLPSYTPRGNYYNRPM